MKALSNRLRRIEKRYGTDSVSGTKTWVIYIVSKAGERGTPYAEVVWSRELGGSMKLYDSAVSE
jgi:hypothetical protein